MTADIPQVRQTLEALNVLSQETVDSERARMRLKARRDRADDLRGIRQEGIELGLALGSIRVCQEYLGLPQTSRDELKQMPEEELARLAAELEEKLFARP